MTPYQAQRIRFGILAARHMLERWRLRTWQVDDMEGCVASGWKWQDAIDPFDASFSTSSEHMYGLKSRAALRAHDRKAMRKRRWLRA